MRLNRSAATASTRVQCLAELAETIENAQRLAWQLGTADRPSAEARELYSRLEAARLEVETIRGMSVHTPLADPAWLEALGWSGNLLDPAD